MPARDYPSSLTWLQPSLWDYQHSDHLKPAGKLLRNRQRVLSVTAQIVSLLCGIRAKTSGLMHPKWVLYHTAVSLAPDCFWTDIGNASCLGKGWLAMVHRSILLLPETWLGVWYIHSTESSVCLSFFHLSEPSTFWVKPHKLNRVVTRHVQHPRSSFSNCTRMSKNWADQVWDTSLGSQASTGKMWHAKELEFLFKS